MQSKQQPARAESNTLNKQNCKGKQSEVQYDSLHVQNYSIESIQYEYQFIRASSEFRVPAPPQSTERI